ncbi:DinB/UmuC family translesion DNA polymerase [Ectopseudomonas chengduensis]
MCSKTLDFGCRYVKAGAEKLRQQGSLYRQIRVNLRTGMFNPSEAKYANSLLCQLPYPTDDTRLIIATAREGISRLYRNG